VIEESVRTVVDDATVVDLDAADLDLEDVSEDLAGVHYEFVAPLAVVQPEDNWGLGNAQFLRDFVANTKNIDCQREAGWLVLDLDGRGTRWIARILNALLVWKSGRPISRLVREYWVDILWLSGALVLGVGFNVWLWRR
jgi:hypothetical protein